MRVFYVVDAIKLTIEGYKDPKEDPQKPETEVEQNKTGEEVAKTEHADVPEHKD